MHHAHPLDQTTHLNALETGTYQGNLGTAYANMVGPFGGVIAAVMLNAVLQDQRRLGEPVSLTVNFAGPISEHDFQVNARIARTNRSTQHWLIELVQNDEITVTATALLAIRRSTWSDCEISFPTVAKACEVPLTDAARYTPWAKNYQLRQIDGALTFDPNDICRHSQSTLWIQDNPARCLDFLSLTAIADIFFPRIFVRQQKPCPAGTVSMTLYFHADSQTLTNYGSRPILGRAQAQQFRDGFFDQHATLWSEDGTLLASSNQLVYYKT